jgi:uncharacterized membrane protein YbhN (UPF0104 family)
MTFANVKISDKTKTRLTGLTKLLISLGIILFLVFGYDYQKIVSSLKNVNVILLSIAAVLVVPNLLIQFLKWKVILSDVFRVDEIPAKKIWHSFILGLGAGMITPWNAGEYVGRAIPFEIDKSIRIILSTFIDKITTLFILMFFGSMASLYFLQEFYQVNSFITIPILVAVFLLSGLLFYLLTGKSFDKKMLALSIIPKKYKSNWISKLSFLDSISERSYLFLFLFSFSQLAVVFTQFIILIFAFGGSGSIVNLLLASLLVFFSKSFFPPITVADLGVREGTAVFFFGQFGVSNPVAFNAAIFLFVINLLIPSLYTLILTLKKKV